MSQERRPSLGFWTTVAVVAAPLVYIMSFGVACWLVTREVLPARPTARVYRPLVRAATSQFRPVAVPLCWYADLFAFDDFTPTWGNSSDTVEKMNFTLGE